MSKVKICDSLCFAYKVFPSEYSNSLVHVKSNPDFSVKMAANLACDKFWVNKNMYHDAEKKFYECAAKLQRRLEIFGGRNEETNNKKINNSKSLKKYKKIHNNVDVDELKKQLLNLEAQENAKNKMFHSETQCYEIIKPKEDHGCEKNKFSNSEKKKQNREHQKEKENRNEKKPKRNKENEDDLLGGVGMTKISQDSFPKSSLAGEVAKARQHIKSSLECMENMNGVGSLTNPRLMALLEDMKKAIENLTKRVEVIEKNCMSCNKTGQPQIAVCPAKPQAPAATKAPAKDDDDVIDLFSDSEEEDEAAKKIREQRLAEYAAKKSKKPALVAKSNIILDIKPWDDETDMKQMEKEVRAIEMDGLIWGASKLVPVAFKIFKLQISCVIEDDKVSVDVLTEKLEEIEDYIQSVDIAAFNKV